MLSVSPAGARARSCASLAVIAVAVALVAVGCGGGAKKVSAAATTTTNPDRQAAFAAYTACLRQHGVNLPAGFGAGAPGTDRRAPGTPPSLPPGADQSTFSAARQACRDKLPAGFGRGRANNPAFQAYLSCLRDHGVAVPTTTANGQGGTPPPTIDRGSPAFQSANATCGVLLPNRAGPGATTPTTA